METHTCASSGCQHSPAGFALLTPPTIRPAAPQRERFLAYLPSHTSGVAFIMLASSVNAVCYNLVHSSLIKRTSAVTATVLGEIKIVGLLILSTFLLGTGAR